MDSGVRVAGTTGVGDADGNGDGVGVGVGTGEGGGVEVDMWLGRGAGMGVAVDVGAAVGAHELSTSTMLRMTKRTARHSFMRLPAVSDLSETVYQLFVFFRLHLMPIFVNI